MPNTYYSLFVNQSAREADIDIYGDITSWPWFDGDMSAYNLSQRLSELDDVDVINVNINSYGGEVAEGLAIYNALRRHHAAVRTRVDGFACSIASVIFMAGDERVINEASLLMIHNAWTLASGNAAELRKQADDLETITNASKAAYLSRVSITEEELTGLMDAESWIDPETALADGFATYIESYGDTDKPSQNARMSVMRALLHAMEEGEEPEPVQPDGHEPEPEPVEGPVEQQAEPEPGPEEPVGEGEEGEEPEPDPEPEEEPEESLQASKQAANLAAFLMSF